MDDRLILTKPDAASTPTDASCEPCRDGQTTRFTAVLRGSAKGLGCVAAELWLLDDATQALARRAAWEADPTQPPKQNKRSQHERRLADAEADLAALAGGAVVLESPSEVAAWRPHRSAPAAMCLPVSSDRTIHGVVWFFADHARRFDDATVELAEIVGGRLAVELERDALLAASMEPAAVLPTPEAASPERQADAPSSPPTPEPAQDLDLSPLGMFTVDQTPSEVISVRLPATPRLPSTDLEVAGWASPQAAVALSDELWLPDGRLLAWCATVVDPPSEDVDQLIAAEGSARALREAARRMAISCDDPGQLLRRMSEPLWAPGSSGDGFAVALAIVEPSDDPGLGGRGAFAAAGPCLATRVRASAIGAQVTDAPPLGWDDEATYPVTRFELKVRERLVLIAGDPRLTSPLVERRLTDAYRAATAEAHRGMTAQDCLARLKKTGVEAVQAATAIRRV